MKYGKNVYHALTMITQFGINMLVPVFLCSFAGMYIDEKLGTAYWMIILFFIGALAGFRNVFIFARRIYTMESKGDTSYGKKKSDAERTKKDR
ncbi:AtpZ/AtpI family protein [Kineothrix sp. MB12-C1]|uniref:AtpZ/AtpI family protein n=1 Tax=Kineothrix sp. MB12-C1 TaxID=3070215 RepID=UPI0027D20DCD|nr:AtpZ/AtpI family protein [Kineothrix sp. MB12-C1]WMC94123.1 AtpZ/AtpI family protein [Kineothrix sp. MB12-C1]